MDRWDVLLILVAGYMAVMSLVRLMRERRNQVLEHLRGEIEQQLGKATKKTTEQQEGTETNKGDNAAA